MQKARIIFSIISITFANWFIFQETGFLHIPLIKCQVSECTLGANIISVDFHITKRPRYTEPMGNSSILPFFSHFVLYDLEYKSWKKVTNE